jgi:general secretion pathway protein M
MTIISTKGTAARLDVKATRRLISAAIYVALLGAFIATTWVAVAGLGERRATVQAAESMLAQLQGRSPLAAKNQSPLGGAPAGSPFLEGNTVNVAGAALLQRVAAAVSRVSGNILSSQVELQRPDAKEGWVGLVVSCEIQPGSLQQLLYDIESGMPFLFIDQLAINPPVIGVDETRMRVLLGVSGQWAGATGAK